MYVYILELENQKYYVGQTNNPQVRIEQHQHGEGSTWTLKHKPIKVLSVVQSTSPFDENNTTKMMMIQYGIDSVRGGSYCTEYIDPIQKALLQKELWGVNNCCIRCGYPWHFISECRKKIDVNGNKITLKSVKPKIKNVKKNENGKNI